MKNRKCLVLLSGGLDSRLTCKTLQEQLGRQNVEAVFFVLPFGGGCCSDRGCVFKFAQKERLKLNIVDCTKGPLFRKYMGMVRSPKHGRGSAMNPCVDCHLFMIREAKKLAARIGADFLATGEVVGQRPMSQHRPELEKIEKEAGLAGLVLRPLSAKLLPETVPEKKGWVDRGKLLAISGRQRKEQMKLARAYGITYPHPAGGCLLTEKSLAPRLQKVLELFPSLNPWVVEMVKLGRHFHSGKSIIVVGRNREENGKLLVIADKIGAVSMQVKGYMGPDTIVVGKPGKKQVAEAAGLTVRYSDAPAGKKVWLSVKAGNKGQRLQARAASQNMINRLLAA
jgi:hypothetical protein